MAYTQQGLLDRSLTDAEEAQFKKYALENDPPPGASASILHPVCRGVWLARGWKVSQATGRLIRCMSPEDIREAADEERALLELDKKLPHKEPWFYES